MLLNKIEIIVDWNEAIILGGLLLILFILYGMMIINFVKLVEERGIGNDE